ncbi:MAG: response regulator transcription factor [Rhodanobacter sp.]|uniref:Response regulator transcription factor n=1 Tax=Rhodanobacter glycinis TaxID=582702 RepID=A0A5B9DUB8_9GAMM|nr:response regulator transcription factor [Rhodanobacter glycinis]QEE23103.1 response regulator transcription factor [Rhodanobacter glycinis]TAM22646.1 MAG: response regulator transcription factor [Rhodanobacter sp.]
MRVLIVEDDRETRDWIDAGLLEEGYLTQAVGDGREGVALAVQGHFDGIVVDRKLPGLDGINFIRAARSADVQSGIIMLTALCDTRQRIEGLDAGADDYLGKPFAMAELVARLRALSRRPALNRESTLLEWGPLVLDLTRHVGTCMGEPLDLTPTEFRLFEILMRHAGKVVTRSMLLEQVWNFHFNLRTSVVETHMSRLRGKVRVNGGESLIETVRGYGYRLQARSHPA